MPRSDARIVLGSQPLDIYGAYQRGAETKQRNQLFEMAKDDRDRRIEAEESAATIAAQERERAAAEEARKKNLESVARGAIQVKPLLDSIESVPQAVKTLEARVQEIEGRGGDASDTKEVLAMIQDGDIRGARMAVASAIEVAERFGVIKPGSGANASIQDRNDLLEGFSPEEQERARRIEAGLEPRAMGSSSITIAERGLTDAVAGSQAQIAGESAGAKTQRSGEAKRVQDVITQGQQVADSVPTLKRTLQLLDTVSTGGVLNQAQLQFAQKFGIESADQGELNAMLGKAVLSQLRETFGAQFTEQEGQRLEAIEAGFGKNNETNKRLLKNALAIVEAKAKRAVKLARKNDDEVTAQIIEEALEMELTEQPANQSVIRYDAQGNRIG